MKPLSVPKVEITAPIATSTPPTVPHITRATSASGADEAARSAEGTTPIATVVTEM